MSAVHKNTKERVNACCCPDTNNYIVGKYAGSWAARIFTFCKVYFFVFKGQWEQQYREQQYRDGFHDASVKCWLTIKKGQRGLNYSSSTFCV